MHPSKFFQTLLCTLRHSHAGTKKGLLQRWIHPHELMMTWVPGQKNPTKKNRTVAHLWRLWNGSYTVHGLLPTKKSKLVGELLSDYCWGALELGSDTPSQHCLCPASHCHLSLHAHVCVFRFSARCAEESGNDTLLYYINNNPIRIKSIMFFCGKLLQIFRHCFRRHIEMCFGMTFGIISFHNIPEV